MSAPSDSHAPIPEPSHGNLWLSVLGVLGCFLIFVIVLLVKYVPARASAPAVDIMSIEEDQRWKYDVAQREAKLRELQATASDKATTYGWVDQSAGVVRLPIERAMQLVAQEQGAKR